MHSPIEATRSGFSPSAAKARTCRAASVAAPAAPLLPTYGFPQGDDPIVATWLAERGWGEVEEVSSAEEHLIFALPPELRRDLKAAGKA